MKYLFLCLLGAISIDFCQKQPDSAVIYQMATGFYFHDSERVEYMMPHPDLNLPGTERLGSLNGRLWPKNGTGTTPIKITFRDGAADLQAYIKELWRIHIEAKSNIKFIYVAANESPDQIISFTPNNQSWSYMGTDCHQIASTGNITMNLGWLTASWAQKDYKEIGRVAVHEQYHAIGYVHNQNSPSCASVIKYNYDVIYAKYARLGWTKEMVDQNVLMFYSGSQVADNGCDLGSIMQYQIGSGEANVTAPVNYIPSDLDISKMVADYPPLKVDPPPPASNNLALNKSARQSSEYGGYPASNAFDGNINTFSHTQNPVSGAYQVYPWIQVDLGQTANTTGLDITGRQNCCQFRIREFRVFASNTNAAPKYDDPFIYGYNAGASGLNKVKADNLSGSGRYITFMAKNLQAGDYLSLAELQVFGVFSGAVCKDTTYVYRVLRDSVVNGRVCR